MEQWNAQRAKNRKHVSFIHFSFYLAVHTQRTELIQSLSSPVETSRVAADHARKGDPPQRAAQAIPKSGNALTHQHTQHSQEPEHARKHGNFDIVFVGDLSSECSWFRPETWAAYSIYVKSLLLFWSDHNCYCAIFHFRSQHL